MGIGCISCAGSIFKAIALLFNSNEEIIAIIILFLLTVPLSYGAYAISLLAGSIFNAVNKPMHAAVLIVIRLFVFMIPLALLGVFTGGILRMFIGVTIVNLISGLVAYLWVRNRIR